MKKHILITLVTLLMLFVTMLAPTAFAQESRRRGENKVMSREQFEKRKMDYVVKQAELTKEEAKQFLPLLKRMNEKRRKYHEKIRDMVEGEREGKLKTDDDYLKMILEMSKCMEGEKSVEVQYLDSFLQVIHAKKYYKYKQAEFRFLNHMMRERGRHHRGGSREDDKERHMHHDPKDMKGPHDPCDF